MYEKNRFYITVCNMLVDNFSSEVCNKEFDFQTIFCEKYLPKKFK